MSPILVLSYRKLEERPETDSLSAFMLVSAFSALNLRISCFSTEPCLQIEINAGTLGTYLFPQSQVGTVAERECQYGSIRKGFVLSRTCVMNRYGRSEWTDVHISGNCKHGKIAFLKILRKMFGCG